MTFREGDPVLIVYGDRKYLRFLTKDFNLNVRERVLKFEHILGKRPGDEVGGFFLLNPTLEDMILLGFRRQTQIVYPKDSFYIAFKLGLSCEGRLLEFGVGSGASTAVFSQLAGEVWAFEVREDFYQLAMKNWQRFGLCKNVKLYREDFMDADLEQEFFNAAFVDVKDPTPYVQKVWKVLKPGSPMASLLPTTNQVCSLLSVMESLFCSVEVMEILHRPFKTNPQRFRPQDTMNAHTGYLVFGRKRV